jgi:uncharacterized BrkB/YihY/UPF0761 family membrane protein
MKSLPKKQPKKAAEKTAVMALGAINYIMIALGALIIGASYWGMYLEKSVDGFFSLFISPVTLVGAYIWVVFALLYRPEPDKKQAG